jgi:hydroxypyruvate reductase
MAAGVERALGDEVLQTLGARGWVNVPAGIPDKSKYFHLHGARPIGVNEPTDLAQVGTEAILELVRQASQDDCCLCLLSGGASALLVAPAEGISLTEKQVVTRLLTAAGAGIADLNTVRRSLSSVKGGGLAAACRAGRLITLVLSDVLGDPLDVIGSGPTIPLPSSAGEALDLLNRYAIAEKVPTVVEWLNRRIESTATTATDSPFSLPVVHHILVGNLSTAMQAAAEAAGSHGFSTTVLTVDTTNPTVEREAAVLARSAIELAGKSPLVCVISGGEPVIKLADPSIRGSGGRNQQLAIAVGNALANTIPKDWRWVLLSAGTDGEDGSTDAAGAIWDERSRQKMQVAALDPADFLRRNDSHTFFQRLGDLFYTGPTGTNVCDLRVLLFCSSPSERSGSSPPGKVG